MSANAVRPENPRRFRTSIVAIASAVLLVGSLQCFVIALQEPMRPALIWFVNLVIQRGHFHIQSASNGEPNWIISLLNLVNGVVGISLTYWLANWNYEKRGKRRSTV